MKTRFWLGAGLALAAQLAQAQGTLTFTALAAMPVPHYGMGYCTDGQNLYQTGGGSPSTAYTADVYRYNPVQNVWAPGAATFTPQRFGTAAILDPSAATGLIYVLNGQQSSAPVPVLESVRLLDSSPGPSSPNPQPTGSAGSAVWNGLLYCFGGSSSGTYSSAVRAYNPQANTWTTLAAMPEAKETRGAAVNGKIYAFGGYNGVVNSSRVDAYDIATNQWQALGTLPTTVSNQAVAVRGTDIWLVGDFNNQSYLAVYSTVTNQLRTFTSNLPPRRNAAAAIIGDQLYVWGGNTASANSSALGDVWRANVAGVATATAPAASLAPLQAYPNPLVADALHVVLPTSQAAAPLTLTVCDAQGREVRCHNCPPGPDTELSLGALAPGLYLVRATTAAGQPVAACRLVKQ